MKYIFFLSGDYIELGKEEGVLGDEERKILHRIFEFGDTQVGDVMTPKEKIVSTDVNTPGDKLLDLVTEEGHSYLPVFEGERDHIFGVLYARDLLYLWRSHELIVVRDLIHQAHTVGPNERVIDLLRDFQRKGIRVAIVIDPKGNAQGLVTLEDLTEEIVGEIPEPS